MPPHIHAPQIIYLILLFIGIGIDVQRHGEPKKPGTHNFWGDIIIAALGFGLLYWGGFFSQP